MKTLMRSYDIWDMMEDGYNELDKAEHQMTTQMTALRKSRARNE